MDNQNQSSSSVPSGQGRVRRFVRYITGASNMFRGSNRVVVGDDNRPQWIIERNNNEEMRREEDRQRQIENTIAGNEYYRGREGRNLLRALQNENVFEGQTYLEQLPPELLAHTLSFYESLPRRRETVEQLGDRLDWNYINNPNNN
jgi:hypothetical protein